MRNNDLISRSDMLEFFDEFIATYSDGFLAIAGDQKEEMTAADMARFVTSLAVSFRNAIDRFSPAKQPMSAVEYERERGRFVFWCNSRKCDTCEWKPNCRVLRDLPPEERVAAMQKWAQEHPEQQIQRIVSFRRKRNE